MDDDAAAAECRWGIIAIGSAESVVVGNAAIDFIPDLDPELVDTAAAVHLAVTWKGGEVKFYVDGELAGAVPLG